MTENVEEQQERQAMPGRLARVIATRGGLAPPEAPFVIEHREALIYMLCQRAPARRRSSSTGSCASTCSRPSP